MSGFNFRLVISVLDAMPPKKAHKPKIFHYDGKGPVVFWDFSRARELFSDFLKSFSDFSHLPSQQKQALRTFDRIVVQADADYLSLMRALSELGELFDQVNFEKFKSKSDC